MKLFSKKITTTKKVKTGSSGFFDDLQVSTLQSRGSLEVLGLTRRSGTSEVGATIALPTLDLKLEQVPDYGTMVLQNQSRDRPMIVPAHIGFFQHGAQNHATARALLFAAGEKRKVDDCFCIQAAQGGLLKKTEQRFLMLPSGLRAIALSKQIEKGYDRLWNDIDGYTRSFGVARGGHLERFLRPNFRHLLPFRHAFEATTDQIGGAYFVANNLVGVEVFPSQEYFAELLPILSIYCYGPAALLAERSGKSTINEPVELTGLLDVNDLNARLDDARDIQRRGRARILDEVLNSKWNVKTGEHRSGLSVLTIEQPGWVGQVVQNSDELLYTSIFKA